MGSSRIKNIVPVCDYRSEGISSIKLLDMDDFKGIIFSNDSLYESNIIDRIVSNVGIDFIEMDTPESAKVVSTLKNGIYTHTIETFIGDISSSLIKDLHLSTKHRYIAIFETNAGRFFLIGYEAGATVNYTSQTADTLGSLVNISAQSIYPLLEVSLTALLPIPVLGKEDNIFYIVNEDNNYLIEV